MKGTIKKKKNKDGSTSHYIRVDLGVSPTGERIRHCETVRGKSSDAQARLTELLHKHNLGDLTLPSKQTLKQYLESWVGGSLEGTVSPRTYSDYKEILARYVYESIGHVKLTALQPLSLESLYKEMRHRGLSARTIRYVNIVLSRALERATRQGLVSRNVAKLVDLPKIKRKKKVRSFDFTQAEAFLTAAAADRFFALWVLALDSGMRPEEYLALQWSDIDFGSLTIHVQRVVCVNRKGGGYYFDEEMKTSESDRVIEIAPFTAELLERHAQTQAEDRARAGKRWKDLGLVFTNYAGGPLLLSNLHRRHFKPILERARLSSEWRVYDLRHSCATLLGAMGVRTKVIQDRLGHSSSKTTLDLYSHVLPSEQGVASGNLQRRIFEPLATAPAAENSENGDRRYPGILPESRELVETDRLGGKANAGS